MLTKQRGIEAQIRDVKEMQFREFIKTSAFGQFSADVWKAAEQDIKAALGKAADKAG